jgi:hypothetical protein
MDRPRRAVKRPITYWEEYVVTDTWYTTALVEDVPAGELYAALEDEDFSLDECEESEECDNILSDKCESSNYGTDDCSDSDSSEGSEGAEEVLGASEGESGSEGSDECSSPGSVR